MVTMETRRVLKAINRVLLSGSSEVFLLVDGLSDASPVRSGIMLFLDDPE